MAWQVHCKYCYHVFTITSESAAQQSPSDGTLAITCPSCDHTDEYRAGDVANCDLAQAS